jgi:FADH2 O2-dependent halogenase
MTTPAAPRPAGAGPDRTLYDVALLGNHLATALLGAVLAKHGLRVLLVDGAEDAAEPSGETTVPYTAEVFFTLARRFGIPEIASFGLTCDLPADVQRTSGAKHSLGFLYHRPGRAQDPRQAVQFNVPGEHSEWHPYRPHVDQHARAVAVSYGVHTVPHRPVATDVLPEADSVRLLLSDGTTRRARYVVDGSGPGSPLLARLATADPVPGYRHRARLLATHLSGVTPFEETVDQSRYVSATPWSKGTVSHLFDGGWVQVAHFDNREEPGNHTAGVTVSLDPERFADLPEDPERAFRTLIARYPSLEAVFTDAVAVKPWVREELWQHTASRTVGDRWFLFDRTAGRNDLFLSRDVTMGAELALALAPALLRAHRTGDWSAAAFADVARFQRELGAFNDRLLAAARTATRDFRLWNAYSRVWLLWSMLAALALKSLRNRSLATGSWERVENLTNGPYWFALPTGLPELLDHTFALLDRVERDEISAPTAAERLFAALREAPFTPPLYGFGDPEDRYYHFSPLRRLRTMLWSKTTAPAEFRTMLTKENVTNKRPAAVH